MRRNVLQACVPRRESHGPSFRHRWSGFGRLTAPTRFSVLGLLEATVAVELLFIGCVRKVDTLDARLVYTPAQALAALQALDAPSRAFYRAFNLADFAFIGLYSTLLVTWLRFLACQFPNGRVGRPYLGLIPGSFDVVESLGVAWLLRASEPESSLGLWLAVVGTPLKWGSVLMVLGVVLQGEFRLWQRRRNGAEKGHHVMNG